jgi:hypothetical protein
MKLQREDLVRMGLISVLSAPPIAFMAFDFFFPNISTPSLGKNMLVALLLSILAGMPSGYFSRRVDAAMVTVILYGAVGYSLAVVLYSAPYLIFNLELLVPSFYYTMFFRFTIILLFMFVLGGFMGAVFGSMVRDSISREETSLTFRARKD